MSVVRSIVLSVALIGAAGCSDDAVDPPVEVLAEAPAALYVEATGELRSTAATALLVPGPQGAQRQLEWVIAEGSQVKAGDLLARFVAMRSELELTQAEIDVRRQLLARNGKEGELGTNQSRLAASLAQVDTNLRIAERYADADLDMFARNEILDAVQDVEYLGTQRGFLTWKQDQSQARGAAEVAVIDSAAASAQNRVKLKSSDLQALELRAPNDGVFTLDSDWGGEKPQIGATLWSGMDFGRLPDPTQLEVTLSVPQLDAEGLKVGSRVELSPLGRPEAAIVTALSQVAQAAQVRSQRDPSKYVHMRATVPAADAARLGLLPGASVQARLFHAAEERALTVPNVALIVRNGEAFVDVLEDGETRRVAVTLGARGAARSVVDKGLSAGDRIVLTPERDSREGRRVRQDRASS